MRTHRFLAYLADPFAETSLQHVCEFEASPDIAPDALVDLARSTATFTDGYPPGFIVVEVVDATRSTADHEAIVWSSRDVEAIWAAS